MRWAGILVVSLVGCAGHVARPPAPPVANAPVYDDDSPIPNDGVRTVLASGHAAFIGQLALSPDEKWLVSSSEDGVVKLWVTASLREVATGQLASSALDLAVTNDGEVYAALMSGGGVRWSATHGLPPAKVSDDLVAVRVASDGAVVLVGNRCSVVGGPTFDLPFAPFAVRFDAAGGLVAIADNGSTLRVADVRTKPAVGPVQSRAFRNATLSADGSAAAAVVGDGVDVWPVAGGGPHHFAVPDARDPLLSPDGKTVYVLADARKRVMKIDVLTGRASPSELAPDAQLLVGSDRIIVGNGEYLSSVRASDGEATYAPTTHAVDALEVAPDGSRLYVAGYQVNAWTLGGRPSGRRFGADASLAGELSASPNGDLLARGFDDGVRLFRGSTGREATRLGAKQRYRAPKLTSDGRSIWAMRDRELAILPVDGSAERVLPPGLPLNAGARLAVRDDGNLAAVGTSLVGKVGNSLAVQSASGEQRVLLRAPARTFAVAFRPHTATLASGDADGKLRFWETQASSDAPSRTIELGDAITALRFSSDGKRLAAGLRSGVTKLLDSDTGAAVFETPASCCRVGALAFLADGRLVTGHQDGHARIWSPDGKLAAELATTRAQEWIAIGADGRFESSSDGEIANLYGVKETAVVPWSPWSQSRRRSAVLTSVLRNRKVRDERAPGIVVQGWPREAVVSLAFSGNGSVLAASTTNETFFFDLRTGVLSGRVSNGMRAAVSADGSRLAVSTDLTLALFSPTGETLAQHYFGAMTGRPIAWLDERRVLLGGFSSLGVAETDSSRQPNMSYELPSTTYEYAAGTVLGADTSMPRPESHSGQLQRWRVDGTKLTSLGEVRCSPRHLTAIALSGNARSAACADVSGLITELDLPTGRQSRWRPSPYQSMDQIPALAFHPTRPVVAAATLHGVFVHDPAKGTVRVGPERRTDSLAFSADGSLLAAASGWGEIDLYETTTWQTTRELRSRQVQIASLAVDPSAPRLFISSKTRSVLWSAADGGADPLPIEKGSQGTATFAESDDVMFTGTLGTLVASKGRARKETWRTETADVSWQHLAVADKRSLVVALSRDLKGSTARRVFAFDAATGTQRWVSPKITGDPNGLAVSPDGNLVAAVGNDVAGSLQVYGAHDGARLFGVDGRKRQGIDYPFNSVAFVSNRVVAVSARLDEPIRLFEADSGKELPPLGGFRNPQLAALPSKKLLAIADDPGRLTILDTETWREQVHVDLPMGEPTSIAWLGGKTIAVLAKSGEVHFYNLDKRTGATLALLDSGAVALVGDDGSYLAPRDAAGSIGFNVAGHAYPFEQFDAQYNNPSVALAAVGFLAPALAESYAAAREKRIRALGITPVPGDTSLPVVDISPIPATAPSASIRVHVTATDSRHRLRRLHVTDNGVALFGANGVPLDGKSAAQDVTIDLAHGPNRLKFVAENDVGATSLERSEVVSLVGAAPKPAVHVIAVGVTHYRDPALDLTFAAKDAADVAAAFPAAKPVILTDAHAMKRAILDTRKVLEQSHVDDTAVVYLSGHGTIDRTGMYYFAPHDIDVNHLAETGVSYAELEGLFERIPARKRLLVIDSCNSGELDPDELAALTKSGKVTVVQSRSGLAGLDRRGAALARNLFSDLRRSSGTQVISASAGAELSYESNKRGNSIFTSALLAGLRDRKADPNQQGEIRVSTLRTYVANLVTELTEGRQTPTARAENFDADFDLTPDAPRPKPWSYDGCPMMNDVWSCGTLQATAAPTKEPADRALAGIRAQLQASAPNVKLTWTNATIHGRPALRVEGTLPGFTVPVSGGVVAYLGSENGGARTFSCVVLDALPDVLARCERAAAEMDGKPLPIELPH